MREETTKENRMSKAEINAAIEDALELFEDNDDGIREAIAYAAERIGVKTRQAERAWGW